MALHEEFFKQPRGKRNNNPFNIDYSKGNAWDGQLGIEPVNPDGQQRFAAFSSPVFGARAFFKLLKTYKDKHKIDTIEKLIKRFAPKAENPSQAYMDFVADALGVTTTDKIDLTDKDTALKLAKAKAAFENGIPAEQVISNKTLERGYELATGSKYTPEEKPLAFSKTKGELPEFVIMSALRGNSLVEEGDIETGVKESIRAQLEARGEQVDADLQPIANTSQNGSQELTAASTYSEEEERVIQDMMNELQGLPTSEDVDVEPEFTEEEEAVIQHFMLGVEQKGPAYVEPVVKTDHELIQEIYGG